MALLLALLNGPGFLPLNSKRLFTTLMSDNALAPHRLRLSSKFNTIELIWRLFGLLTAGARDDCAFRTTGEPALASEAESTPPLLSSSSF